MAVDDFEHEVIDRLARIETKIEKVDALEQRIAALEATDNQRKGVHTFITAAIGLIAGLIGALGGKLL